MVPPPNSLQQLLAVVALGLAATLPFHSSALAQSIPEPRNPGKHWVTTWTLASQTQEPGNLYIGTAPTFANQTLRQIVHTSIGGNKVRVRFSNTFGTTPLRIGAAHVAVRGADAQIQPGTDRVLTFGGRASVTIAPGALLVSDPVKVTVPASGDVAVSMYLPDPTVGTTEHFFSLQTNYVLDGDQTGAINPTVSLAQNPAFFLTALEVYAPNAVGTIVCIGDSITEGEYSTINANNRWPDFLARRLLAQGAAFQMGVGDVGIGGDRVLFPMYGPGGLARFDRDVIARAGVTHVIVLEGINDIGIGMAIPGQTVTAEDLIGGYRQMIVRAHEAGLKIYGATMTPSGNLPPASQAIRQAANDFIRNGGEFDGFFDFDAAVRDPANPTNFLPQFDSGDKLHPNDAGMKAMAKAVNLSLFQH